MSYRLIVLLLLIFPGLVFSRSRPLWAEMASYTEGNRAYFVGVATGAPSMESGRLRSMQAAREEVKTYLGFGKVERLPLQTQRIYEEKGKGGHYTVFRLTWVSRDDLKAYLDLFPPQELSENVRNQLATLLKKLDTPIPLAVSPSMNELRAAGLFGQLMAPPHEVAREGSTRLLLALLEGGANINDILRYHTILQDAVEGNNLETVQLLLDRGADPNLIDRTSTYPNWLTSRNRDISGFTPLMLAAVNDNPAIIKALLEHCADPTFKNYWSKTASEYAVSNDAKAAFSAVVPKECIKDSGHQEVSPK